MTLKQRIRAACKELDTLVEQMESTRKGTKKRAALLLKCDGARQKLKMLEY